MSDDEFEYDHNEEEDTGVGNVAFTSMDLGDCKELEQPAPIQATLCRKGVHVILKDNPCKVADLKVSKTGKHGSAKANIVGYDIITGKKYQVTEPGHATLFSFNPCKIEYEVADISGNQITAMTPEGEERFFQVPAGEVGEKLVADFKANAAKGGDAFWNITVLYAPRMVGKNWQANLLVESYKSGKD